MGYVMNFDKICDKIQNDILNTKYFNKILILIKSNEETSLLSIKKIRDSTISNEQETKYIFRFFKLISSEIIQ